MLHRITLLTFLVVVLSVHGGAVAQLALPHLHQEIGGISQRVSSSNEDLDVNGDSIRISPGEQLLLADLEGPGIITRLSVTAASEEPHYQRLLRLRMYWDGEDDPSVDVPLGDFFGAGHGLAADVDSAMTHVTSGGRAHIAYWSMPFRRNARITLTNEGTLPVDTAIYAIDWRSGVDIPKAARYFHAQYRQQHPTVAGEPYVVADIEGEGHYVGTVLNVRKQERGWWGEGDEFVYIDGAEYPQLRGTGTDDYFGQAYGLRKHQGPFTGVPILEGNEPGAHLSMYRWHIPDAITFTDSLRFEFEHRGYSGALEYQERIDDFSSVAFWYQQEPHKPFEDMPIGYQRLYFASLIEGVMAEDLPADDKQRRLRDYLREGAIQSDPAIFESDALNRAQFAVRITNPTSMTCEVVGRITGREGINTTASKLEFTLPPKSGEIVTIDLDTNNGMPVHALTAVQTDWTFTYFPEFQEPVTATVRHFLKVDAPFACPLTSNAITIDGVLDDWPDLPFIADYPQQIRVDYTGWQSPEDARFRFGVNHDGRHVNIAVEVFDDAFQLSPMEDPWWQDGIEIRLDGRPDPVRSNWDGAAGEFEKFVFFALTPVEPGDAPVAVAPEKLPAGSQFACVRTETGYIAEVAVPVAYLNAEQGGTWEAFRLNIAIDDLDAQTGPFAQIWWRPDWRYGDTYTGSGTFYREE